jgi:hypothetical protein
LHEPTEDERDDSSDICYEELEQAVGSFPKYHMKILLENCNAKFWKYIFKLKNRDDSLHENGNLNRVARVNIPT